MILILSSNLGFDTLFLLSGFFLSFSSFRKTEINPLLIYLQVYLRYTPTYGIIILILSTLTLHFGYGPNWNKMEIQAVNWSG